MLCQKRGGDCILKYVQGNRPGTGTSFAVDFDWIITAAKEWCGNVQWNIKRKIIASQIFGEFLGWENE